MYILYVYIIYIYIRDIYIYIVVTSQSSHRVPRVRHCSRAYGTWLHATHSSTHHPMHRGPIHSPWSSLWGRPRQPAGRPRLQRARSAMPPSGPSSRPAGQGGRCESGRRLRSRCGPACSAPCWGRSGLALARDVSAPHAVAGGIPAPTMPPLPPSCYDM